MIESSNEMEETGKFVYINVYICCCILIFTLFNGLRKKKLFTTSLHQSSHLVVLTKVKLTLTFQPGLFDWGDRRKEKYSKLV